jgi:hypothetical protein
MNRVEQGGELRDIGCMADAIVFSFCATPPRRAGQPTRTVDAMVSFVVRRVRCDGQTTLRGWNVTR